MEIYKRFATVATSLAYVAGNFVSAGPLRESTGPTCNLDVAARRIGYSSAAALSVPRAMQIDTPDGVVTMPFCGMMPFVEISEDRGAEVAYDRNTIVCTPDEINYRLVIKKTMIETTRYCEAARGPKYRRDSGKGEVYFHP